MFFTSYFIDVNTFYLLLNWFSMRVSDDQKYLCGSKLYACINTWKFKGLNTREITSLSDIQKSDLHGTSIQSLPKINRMLITRHICIQWQAVMMYMVVGENIKREMVLSPNDEEVANSSKKHTQLYPTIAILLIKILIFFNHSVVFTCSKVINAFN